ncbi:hypothetical protein [Pseudoalteromonas ruthenica]|uniref:hypothetical protein n=1 Tax=Pseudoalteromonas ruthenica TaxID=151081 RepID=UPI00241F3E49|nr:hypothetical protein [Pseudoalteromonas ruthenica]|tara:strand:+ start:68616 stop:69065 length:450 start_codon:yes stop_codon:yes gene_type:complete
MSTHQDKGKRAFVIAALLSFLGALAHLLTIFAGAHGYRTMGAGEAMAKMAARGELYPTFVTLGICIVLIVWGVYALSAAQLVRALPLRKTALVLITLVLSARALGGLYLATGEHSVLGNSALFWLISSLLCLGYAATFLIGLTTRWKRL